MISTKKIVAGVSGAVAFVLVVVILIHILKNPMLATVQSQLAALKAGDVEKAYSYTSNEFKSATSLEDFKNFVTPYPAINDNQSVVFSTWEIKDDTGIMKGVLYGKHGVAMPVQYLFVKELGKWRILGIELNPVDSATSNGDSDAVLVEESGALTKTYDNQESRYTMKYPASWEYEKSGDGTVIFSGRQGSPAYFATVNIQTVLTRKNGGDFSTTKQFMTDIQHQALSQSPSVKFLETGKVEVSEKNGKKDKGEYTIFTYKYKGKEFKQWQVVVLRNDGQVFYAWAYTSPIDFYPKFEPIAKSMLESWVIY